MNIQELRKLAYDAFYKPEEDGTVFIKIPINANDGTLLLEKVYRYEKDKNEWTTLPIDNQTMIDLIVAANEQNIRVNK